MMADPAHGILSGNAAPVCTTDDRANGTGCSDPLRSSKPNTRDRDALWSCSGASGADSALHLHRTDDEGKRPGWFRARSYAASGQRAGSGRLAYAAIQPSAWARGKGVVRHGDAV